MVGMFCAGLFAIGTRCCCVGSDSGADCGGVGCDGVDMVAAGLVGGAVCAAAGVECGFGCPCCCMAAGVALGTVADCVGCVVAGAALGLGPCVAAPAFVAAAAVLFGLAVVSCWLVLCCSAAALEEGCGCCGVGLVSGLSPFALDSPPVTW